MTDTAIHIENVSKRYFIGALRDETQPLGTTLARAVLSPFRRSGKLLRGHASGAAELDETLWALQDINLDVKRGELLGIIGANGAGKSTLLKILARITSPTTGRIVLNGRVGSLLEVGTGFHQELTGRENVYLNGSMLGMSHSEIKQKLLEIVEFANVESFIDTPVKHYSSGMRVRLAFSVAAHLDADILLVDEVLAVGDASFQRRSLGKMENVSHTGKTVMFVSHDMMLVQDLCPRSVLLEEGRITYIGETAEAIRRYLGEQVKRGGEQRFSHEGTDQDNGRPCRIHALRVRDHNQIITERVSTLNPFYVEVEYEVIRPVADFRLGFTLKTALEDTFATIWMPTTPLFEPGRYTSRCTIPRKIFDQVGFAIGIVSASAEGEQYFTDLEPLEFFLDGATQLVSAGQRILHPQFEWTVQEVKEDVQS
jgi:lipopolysaccharide transport system ATP-binding protein